eukprot:Clim_evm34s211 gene=Clim_evmTU34s211
MEARLANLRSLERQRRAVLFQRSTLRMVGENMFRDQRPPRRKLPAISRHGGYKSSDRVRGILRGYGGDLGNGDEDEVELDLPLDFRHWHFGDIEHAVDERYWSEFQFMVHRAALRQPVGEFSEEVNNENLYGSEKEQHETKTINTQDDVTSQLMQLRQALAALQA